MSTEEKDSFPIGSKWKARSLELTLTARAGGLLTFKTKDGFDFTVGAAHVAREFERVDESPASPEEELVCVKEQLRQMEERLEYMKNAHAQDVSRLIRRTETAEARLAAQCSFLTGNGEEPVIETRDCPLCGEKIRWGKLGPMQYHDCKPILFPKCPDCVYNGPYIMKPCEKHTVKAPSE